MGILKLNYVSGFAAYSALLWTLALPAFAVDPALPWSFVNGAAEGYSIQLLSAEPSPGTAVTAGQSVEFKVTVSYKLSVADRGAIVLVIQDEDNRSLSPGNRQQSRPVARGEGTLTLNESFVVPAGGQGSALVHPVGTEWSGAYGWRVGTEVSGKQSRQSLEHRVSDGGRGAGRFALEDRCKVWRVEWMDNRRRQESFHAVVVCAGGRSGVSVGSQANGR